MTSTFTRLPFSEWQVANRPAERLSWRDAALDQFTFFCRLTDLITSGMPFETSDDFAARVAVAEVIATHTSKSVTLPVVQWTRPDLGLTLTARGNFHDYKLSVSSERPIDDPHFPALFHTAQPPNPNRSGDPLHHVYFVGFPEVLVYGYQAINHRAWSAEIAGSHAMWTVAFLCMRALGAIPSLTWAA